MNTQANLSPQFYLTAPARCPYLGGLMERKVFTHLIGPKATEINDLLTQGGFRRSQNIAYRPACEQCQACVSVRILVNDFKPTRSMRRVLAANVDVVASELAAEPTNEQFTLFRKYLDHRHQQGGMSEMTMMDYSMMVEDTHVNTRIIEYRERVDGGGLGAKGQLLGAALTDIMSDGNSMVYSFYDPELEGRSLGTYMILDHIRTIKERGLPHVYLGYWVRGSKKMDYKMRYLPQEHLLNSGWTRINSIEELEAKNA